MALIRRRSDAPHLEHLSRIIHAALFSLPTWIYWEWVLSKSNRADAISRLGRDGPWYRGNGFSYFQAHFPLLLWHLPLPATIRPSSICECFGEECIGVSPYLVTSGGDPSQGVVEPPSRKVLSCTRWTLHMIPKHILQSRLLATGPVKGKKKGYAL